MERLIPNPHDAAPLINQVVAALDRFGDSVKGINTALYVQGFLTGLTVCATILTAIWAFSRKQ